MKLLRIVLLSILTVDCCVIALFLYLLWKVRSPQLATVADVTSIDVLAINMTMLQVILVLVGFLVAGLGFFGYAGIRTAAVSAAEVQASEVANSQMVKWRAEQERKAADVQSESAGSYGENEAPTGKAVPAGDDE